MAAVDLIVEKNVAAEASTATDRHLMRSVRRGQRPGVLRIYSVPGDLLWLGRYHLSPGAGDAPAGATSCKVWRRHSGGRALPFGDGFVGLSLVLPHRSAWFGDDPLALTPTQVPNRYVRGVMEACRRLGVSIYYPGRDMLTVNGRNLASLSFETDEQGALIFEMVLAVNRDFSVLPQLLDAADRAGEVKSQMIAPNEVTSLGREVGREIGFDELAERIAAGYAQVFGLQLRATSLTALERQAVEALAARELSEAAWVHGLARRSELDRHASSWVQLGVLEAFFSLHQERFLKEIRFAGDFIANSPAIDALQRELRSCPLEWRAIDDVVGGVFSHPENFLLGVGKLRAVADTLTQAAGK